MLLFWFLVALSAGGCWAQSDGFNVACGIVNSLPCDQVTQEPVCGSNGVIYPNECDFAKAQCQIANLIGLPAFNCDSVNTTAMPELTTLSSNWTVNGTAMTLITTTTSDMSGNGTKNSTQNTILTLVPTATTLEAQMNTTDVPQANTTQVSQVNMTWDPQVNTTQAPQVNTSQISQTMTTPVSQVTTTIAASQVNTTQADEVNATQDSQLNTTSSTTTIPPYGLSGMCKILLANPCPPAAPDDIPLCASSAVEYPTLCHFTQAQCTDPDLSIVEGMCPTKPSIEQLICDALLEKPCDDDGVILCGSDGVTYSNSCEFETEKCVHGDLQIVKRGSC